MDGRPTAAAYIGGVVTAAYDTVTNNNHLYIIR